MTPVVVITGKPGSGKSTYALQHMERGDLVIDLDRLFSALSGLPFHDKPAELLPFVCECRDALYARLRRPSRVNRAWIITTDDVLAAHLAKSFIGELVTLEVDESERRRRLENRGNTLGQKSDTLGPVLV